MQTLTSLSPAAPIATVLSGHPSDAASSSALSSYQIIRRNGAVVAFEPNKIAVAIMKASLAVHGTQGAASASVRENVEALTQQVMRALMRSRPGGGLLRERRGDGLRGLSREGARRAGGANRDDEAEALDEGRGGGEPPRGARGRGRLRR